MKSLDQGLNQVNANINPEAENGKRNLNIRKVKKRKRRDHIAVAVPQVVVTVMRRN